MTVTSVVLAHLPPLDLTPPSHKWLACSLHQLLISILSTTPDLVHSFILKSYQPHHLLPQSQANQSLRTRPRYRGYVLDLGRKRGGPFRVANTGYEAGGGQGFSKSALLREYLIVSVRPLGRGGGRARYCDAHLHEALLSFWVSSCFILLCSEARRNMASVRIMAWRSKVALNRRLLDER